MDCIYLLFSLPYQKRMRLVIIPIRKIYQRFGEIDHKKVEVPEAAWTIDSARVGVTRPASRKWFILRSRRGHLRKIKLLIPRIVHYLTRTPLLLTPKIYKYSQGL
jgi:hypothetical protein